MRNQSSWIYYFERLLFCIAHFERRKFEGTRLPTLLQGETHRSIPKICATNDIYLYIEREMWARTNKEDLTTIRMSILKNGIFCIQRWNVKQKWMLNNELERMASHEKAMLKLYALHIYLFYFFLAVKMCTNFFSFVRSILLLSVWIVWFDDFLPIHTHTCRA